MFKIKRFDNLWAMSLILFAVILVALYLIKLIFPQFVISVAEIESIVNFGKFVDKHKWAYYLFNGFTSLFILYFYTCACCRIKYLNLSEVVIIIGLIIISYLVEWLLPNQLLAYNFISYLLIPLIVAFLRKIRNPTIFYSTSVSFILTTIGQSISLEIRGISTLVSYPNTATYFVLLIDAYIWNILLYLFFNYEGDNKNG